jgi:hypothetical protein
MNKHFEDIRPYTDLEAQDAFKRIAASSGFKTLITSYYPDLDFEIFKEEFSNYKTIQEFHDRFGYHIARKAINSSTNQLILSGIEQISPDRAYSFISNHRDIVMDALLLQVYVIEALNSLVEISFGSNLMMNQFIIDIGKTCLMYKTDRSGTTRELYHKLTRLSDYLKYTITEKKRSTWIAQRNGRTKDGLDKTDPGLVKMYSMSGRNDFKNHFIQMNITPIAVSYQYEPCDYMKVRETYLKQLGGVYKKSKNEDYESIMYGINQNKGNSALIITKPISDLEINALSDNYSIFCHELTQLIDHRIINNYKLWNTNYMAYDLLNHSQDYRSKYSDIDLAAFNQYMQETLVHIKDIKDTQSIEKLFLQLYAHPVKNE